MPPATPALTTTLSELPRAANETFSLIRNLGYTIRRSPNGQGQPVLTLPGYGAADGSMSALRFFLRRIGYDTHALQLGRNFESAEDRIQSIDDACDFREKMVELVCERIDEIYEATGEKVALIGWSMGGLYALDASQARSRKVKRVITLGSPFGDPRGTAIWNLMRTVNRSVMPVEEQNFDRWTKKQLVKKRSVPIDVIYSPNDGIVSTDIARLPDHPSVTHHEIDSSHLSFALNEQAYVKVSQLL